LVSKGGRRSDAVQALAELEPAAGRAEDVAAAAAAPFDTRTRVMVSAPHTEHARISLDDGDAVDSPLIEEVRPGKHTAQIIAPGYLPERRELVAVEGALIAVEAPLREKPGRLLVTGPAGAELSIDGRFTATLPLSAPLRVAPGRRFLAITKNGHLPYARDVDVKRDQARSLSVELPISTQRKVAYGMWIAAGAGAAAGGLFSGLALAAQSEARDIESERNRQNISPARADAHDAAIDRRDGFRKAAIISLSASAALGVSGLALFVWDHPAAAAPPVSDEPAAEPPRAPDRHQLEFSLHALLTPDTCGLSFTGRL
jgi:hypothetical protein